MKRQQPPLWPPLYRAEFTVGCLGVPSYALAQVALACGEHGPFGMEVDHLCMVLLGFAYLAVIRATPTRPCEDDES